MKIDIGAGRDKRPGFKRWDISPVVKPDVLIDVSKDKFPVEDNACEEIRISGVLEQILTNEGLLHCMNECHRILQSGGTMTVVVPNAKYSTAFQDPHDVRQFTPSTFKYFDQKEQAYTLYGSVYGYKGWQLNNLITGENGIMTIVLQKP